MISREDVLNAMDKSPDAMWYVAVRGHKPRKIERFAKSLITAAVDEDPTKCYILIHEPAYEKIGCIEWIADERIGFVPDAIEQYQDGYIFWFKKRLP